MKFLPLIALAFGAMTNLAMAAKPTPAEQRQLAAEDDEQLIEVTILAHVDGVDASDLDDEELAFIEDLLGFSFNAVAGDSDFSAYRMHLVSTGNEYVDESEDSSSTTTFGKKKKSRSYYRTHGGMGCRFCGGGDRKKQLRGGSIEGPFGDILAKWEGMFCRMLANSDFDNLSDAEMCWFEFDRHMDVASVQEA